MHLAASQCGTSQGPWHFLWAPCVPLACCAICSIPAARSSDLPPCPARVTLALLQLERVIKAASNSSSYSWCTCSEEICEQQLGGRVRCCCPGLLHLWPPKRCNAQCFTTQGLLWSCFSAVWADCSTELCCFWGETQQSDAGTARLTHAWPQPLLCGTCTVEPLPLAGSALQVAWNQNGLGWKGYVPPRARFGNNRPMGGERSEL